MAKSESQKAGIENLDKEKLENLTEQILAGTLWKKSLSKKQKIAIGICVPTGVIAAVAIVLVCLIFFTPLFGGLLGGGDKIGGATDFSFELSNGGYALTAYSGSDTNVVIPSSYNKGGVVVALGENVFKENLQIESVVIPDSVRTIGNSAFYGCTSLESVDIPNSVTSIGEYAFYGCSNLGRVIVPSGVTSIGNEAFGNAKVYYCGTETDWDSVTQYSFSVYYYSKTYPYESNPSDTNKYWHYVNGNVKEWTVAVADENLFEFEPVSGGYKAKSYNGNDEVVIVPSTYNGQPVVALGDKLFMYQSQIETVMVPDGVQNIGNYTFSDCTGLISVSFANQGLYSIGDFAFYDCTSLESIVLPSSLIFIGSRAFYDCSKLRSIVIPSNVTSISDRAFGGCTSLESVTIPSSVSSIGERAFAGCTSLRVPSRCV